MRNIAIASVIFLFAMIIGWRLAAPFFVGFGIDIPIATWRILTNPWLFASVLTVGGALTYLILRHLITIVFKPKA